MSPKKWIAAPPPPPIPYVPTGPATKVGYGTAVLSALVAVLAYLFPEGDEQTLGVIAAGLIALVSLVVTQIGRFAQANAQIKAQAPLEFEVQEEPDGTLVARATGRKVG